MSWHYSQALVAAYSAANCSAGAPSAPSSSIPTPEACSWPVKTTAALIPSPSGTTCAPSTDALGEAVLTWFLAGFPARTSAPPAKGPASRVPAPASGAKWRASLAKWDRASSSWKTHQRSLLGDWEPFSETWPHWGSMRNGECWAQSTRAPRIGGTGSGLSADTPSGNWPTPTCADAYTDKLKSSQQKPNSMHSVNLSQSVRMWPTPQAYKTTKSGAILNADGTPWDGVIKPHSATSGRPITTALADAVHLYPSGSPATVAMTSSATGTDATPPSANARPSTNGATLTRIPTPSANGWKGSSKAGQRRGQLTDPAMGVIAAGGQLNPTWVEWLMGWPIGWTDCAASATDRFRQWCASHGVFSDRETAEVSRD